MPLKSRPSEIVPPNPADLIESLRDFGYTLPSALADLIDNSLAASAKRITIIVEPDTPVPHIAVIDDGAGMSESRLVEAMRMGTLGPSLERSVADLGRFGLGLKTASLSQGRCVTVVTKHKGKCSIRRWDLDHVRKSGDWQLLGEPTAAAEIYRRRLTGMAQGTAVVIEDLDRSTFLDSSQVSRATHLAKALDEIRGHLGMVFHRFIEEDGLEIRLGEGIVPSWDPFLVSRSTRLSTERLRLINERGEIVVLPFVLPHHSRMSDEEHERAAGPLGWNAHQGFYIYRCRRLIVPGTWLNLRLKKEEHYKLARIRVDLPNTMDNRWQLNVMKSHVAAPSALLDDFKRIASDVRRQASEVYRLRGERQIPAKAKSEHFVWRREVTRTGVRFRIDRTHPVLRALLHSGCEHDAVLASVIALVESTIPVAAMLQEPQKAIDGAVHNGPPMELDLLIDMLLCIEHHLIRTGKNREEARKLVLSCEPFVQCKTQVLDRLRERTTALQESDE